MKKFIREYAAYNLWANEKICSVISSLNDEQLSREIVSSFPSIKKTLLHVWGAQVIWIRRLEGVSTATFPTQDFTGTKEEMFEGMISSSAKLKEMTDGFTKGDLKEVKKYSTLKGGIVTSARYQVLAHVFNHSTYHRGQLVTMLRQTGVSELATMDLIFFYRQQH